MNKIYSAKTVREIIESLFTIDEENKVFKKNEITDKVAIGFLKPFSDISLTYCLIATSKSSKEKFTIGAKPSFFQPLVLTD